MPLLLWLQPEIQRQGQHTAGAAPHWNTQLVTLQKYSPARARAGEFATAHQQSACIAAIEMQVLRRSINVS